MFNLLHVYVVHQLVCPGVAPGVDVGGGGCVPEAVEEGVGS